jgi:hypothetical protein
MPNDSEAPASPAAKLVTDTTLVVAGSSLFLYVVAASYVDGFVKSFGCQAEWFDPSIFQLISFSRIAIVIAALLAGGIWMLMEMRPFTKGWWTAFAVWLLGLVGVHILCVLSPSAILRPWPQLYSAVGFAAIPLIGAAFAARQARESVKERAARSKLPDSPSADDSRAREIIEHPEGRTAEELKWAGSYATKRADESQQRINEIDKIRVELRWKRQFTIVLMTCSTVFLTHQFSSMCGEAMAAVRLQGTSVPRVRVTDNEQDARVNMLFTDGVRTLSQVAERDKNEIIYHNPENEMRLAMGSVVGRRLVPARPTTSLSASTRLGA